MWPLERRCDVVRIGRERVELWQRAPQGFALRWQQALEGAGAPDAAVLGAALLRFFQTASAEAGATKASRRLDVVLESAWVPVMAFDVGSTLWSRQRLEALLRHRFGQLYGERDVQAWDLRLDHRAGDAQGLSYGLAPALKEAIDHALTAAGMRPASLQPALAWGWHQLRTDRKAWRSGWWLWLEQDRSLIGRVERGRLCFLNAGAPVPRDEDEALRLLQIEAVRQGVPELPVRGALAGWSHAPAAVAQPAPSGLMRVAVAGDAEPSQSMQAVLNVRGAA